MKKILKITLIIGILNILICTSNCIYARNAKIKKYEYSTNEVIKKSGKEVNLVTYTFCKPSTVMDFVDENGYFNNVYVSNNNVYWSRYDNNMKQISTKTLPLLYNINTETNSSDRYKFLTYNFGNAVYYDEHLYVLYSRYISDGLSEEDYKNEKVMAMVKYNKNGDVVSKREYKTIELSNSYTVDDINYSTAAPFYTSNCSLAVNDGVIACFYGRNIYM